MLSVWIEVIANAAFIMGTIGICLIAMAALVCVVGRDSEHDN